MSRPYLQVATHQSYSFHRAYTVDPASAANGSTASATVSASTAVATAPALNVAMEDDACGAAAPGRPSRSRVVVQFGKFLAPAGASE